MLFAIKIRLIIFSINWSIKNYNWLMLNADVHVTKVIKFVSNHSLTLYRKTRLKKLITSINARKST